MYTWFRYDRLNFISSELNFDKSKSICILDENMNDLKLNQIFLKII